MLSRFIQSICLLSLVVLLFAWNAVRGSDDLMLPASSPPKPPIVYASDQVELEDIRNFYKRVFGVDKYTTTWIELEKFRTGSAILARKPYLDSWYPEATGGSNSGGALRKYDRAFHNNDPKATTWEAEKHSRQQPTWFGHCNGTGVSSIRYQNPKRSVFRPEGCTIGSAGCVEFTPTDIRALLSEINMNAKAKFISGNRCRLTRAEIDTRGDLRSNPQVMDDCDDVNPGSFHVGLINFLGIMKQPIIFDQSLDEEVWNYPIFSYNFTAQPLTEMQAVAATGLPIDRWIFNPNAHSWFRVSMVIGYRKIPADFTGAGTVPEDMDTLTYEYIVEINRNGNVIGGEWINSSRRNHPDFIWMPFEPAEPTGDDTKGNPFLSNVEVTKLWAESAGLDPKNPFRDKPRNLFDIRFYPPNDDRWGMVQGYYQLLLDGRNTGAAFLGKKTHLRIQAMDASVLDGSTVEVTLNSKAISNERLQDAKLDILFDASPGINLLNLRWNSSRVDNNELNWDFRFYAM